MATQIFIEPELENLSEIQNATEWKSICDELGLSGQNSLAENSATNEAPPYMYIDPKTEAVIRTLCPEKTLLEKYCASAIPLDILQEAQRAKLHGWYPGGLFVYYDNKSPDPFLVGFTKTDSWDAHKHLIGRWGNELLPFEELERKAVDRLLNDAKEALTELKMKVDYAIQNPNDFIKGMLAGKQRPELHFTVNNLRW